MQLSLPPSDAPSSSVENLGSFTLPGAVQSLERACNRSESTASESVNSSDSLPSLAHRRDLRRIGPLWSRVDVGPSDNLGTGGREVGGSAEGGVQHLAGSCRADSRRELPAGLDLTLRASQADCLGRSVRLPHRSRSSSHCPQTLSVVGSWTAWVWVAALLSSDSRAGQSLLLYVAPIPQPLAGHRVRHAVKGRIAITSAPTIAITGTFGPALGLEILDRLFFVRDQIWKLRGS